MTKQFKQFADVLGTRDPQDTAELLIGCTVMLGNVRSIPLDRLREAIQAATGLLNSIAGGQHSGQAGAAAEVCAGLIVSQLAVDEHADNPDEAKTLQMQIYAHLGIEWDKDDD
jgi:hypothetical protein